MLFDVIWSVCGRAELVPEGVSGVQGAASVHRPARRRRRGQGGPVRWPTLLHRQGIAGKPRSNKLKLYSIPIKIQFSVTQSKIIICN